MMYDKDVNKKATGAGDLLQHAVENFVLTIKKDDFFKNFFDDEKIEPYVALLSISLDACVMKYQLLINLHQSKDVEISTEYMGHIMEIHMKNVIACFMAVFVDPQLNSKRVVKNEEHLEIFVDKFCEFIHENTTVLYDQI